MEITFDLRKQEQNEAFAQLIKNLQNSCVDYELLQSSAPYSMPMEVVIKF